MTEKNAAENTNANLYAAAGVDTAAGDLAVSLMKAAVARTHGPEVVGGVGGFAGLFDASALLKYKRPLLASATDGVGTKVAIAQAIDKHDTIGQDLVAMIVDDIVVVGAKPLAMTDYIACGKLVPERIADIVRGIAEACEATGTALVGGETAEHPGLLGENEYDVAGAAFGVVEADALLGPERVNTGDVILAMSSSGIHSNGFSLVRHLLAQKGVQYGDHNDALGTTWGEALLEPTRLYTLPLLQAIETHPGAIHALSHITGGGIAANLARVLPAGTAAEVSRTSWQPGAIFQELASLGGHELVEFEGALNMGIGMAAVVAASEAEAVAATLRAAGLEVWPLAEVVSAAGLDLAGFEQGAKGVDGGAVRLTGAYKG
ncbi:MAG: phosphoribosylformylglycinamidine cyclo-ligase [Microbacteriaceae bacterium]|nr:phosphoribosylformylglycinamidine cyclo-ligase [Microbacteriaceae bacterium]